ncbi:hypothetical protein J2S03_003124 [Alicyclobacillus cycloheptanicus]|uniref:Uncharacterized protein n=1 Tax=Alicyclobacillus cycloheptanicus TaxID=1457 RepID=A0ABT9XMA0_9BACL|nr:hypothetical protein [Alicyclobacillus cycloheptanicus]
MSSDQNIVSGIKVEEPQEIPVAQAPLTFARTPTVTIPSLFYAPEKLATGQYGARSVGMAPLSA